jgi:diguanylate cyclase (GGDEF)-like protein
MGVDSLREGMSYAVVAFDLDDFKPVNDEYGHGAGDEVLTAVAARLREQCRDQDLLARIGGDEFVAVLPGVCEQRLADIIVTRIRLALGEPIAIEGGEVRIGASLGVAIRGLDGMEFTELLKQADERSYIAKRRAKGLPEIESRHDDAASAGRAASKPRLTLVG